MTIDNGVAISLVSIIGGIGVWMMNRFSSLESRMRVQEVSHSALSKSFDEMKQDIRSGLARMETAHEKFQEEFRKETRYVKGRIDAVAATIGTGRLNRDNDDDRFNNQR